MSSAESDGGFIAAALPAFISEADEQIESIEQLLLQLEDAPDDAELLDALFRCAHTVKGSAGIFGLDAVVAFTHHVETLLDALRSSRLALTPALSTLLLQSNDQIKTLVGRATDPGAETGDALAARAAIVERLRQAAAGDTATAPVASKPAAEAVEAVQAADAGGEGGRWQIAVAFNADTFRNGMDPLAILDYLRRIGEIEDIVCDAAAVPPIDQIDPESCHLAFRFALATTAGREEIEGAFSFVKDDCVLELTAPAPRPSAAAPVASHAVAVEAEAANKPAAAAPIAAAKAAAAPVEETRFIRVQADRLDAVINLLGELVIAGAGASLLARESGQSRLVEANQQIARLVEEVRNGTLQLRMVPIGETFARFRRVVRDTASELSKEVALEIVGGDTELDKSVVERIADPLMHLVRNALDHGLEGPDERVASGKGSQGTLTLSAWHESGSISIRIADDGRGIRRDKVLERAWERGLVERGVTPPDAEIDKLIFEPGFSTAEKVTNLSGRGVGMDVVRRNIEALRGSVTIESRPGKGSVIEIRLPLTLAIIDGFLVGVGASKFIFPLEAVVEVIETRAGAQDTHSRGRGRGCVELRGQVLPVVSLRTVYQLETPEPERSSVVVVRAGTHRFGVRVDVLLGQHQAVIKPLGRMFRSLRGMSGSSILGSGEVALIFDVASLAQLAMQAPGPASTPVRQADPADRMAGRQTLVSTESSSEGKPA